MEPRAARPYHQPDYNQEIPSRQSFHRAHASVGAIGSPLPHLLRIGTALAPLAVLEIFDKDPVRQHRWLRIVSLVGAGASETLWAIREQKRREQRETAEHYR
jgi:hypothetical protein